MYMSIRFFFVIASLFLAFAPLLPGTPLFDAEDPVEITIVAPLKSLKNQRGEDPEWLTGGQVVYKTEDGLEKILDVELKARGNFRRQKKICAFPPYWLNFKKSQVAGTLFEGQDRVKVVSHCQEKRRPFDPYIYREYLTYKTYNLLTDSSFRVRLAHINYRDTQSKYVKDSQIGFFIEHTNEVEDRLGLKQVKDQFIPPSDYDIKALCRAEMFQYLVSNLDYTFFDSQDECCHNGKAFRVEGADGGYLPVPYDFDMSGLVNAPYAQPNPALKQMGIRKVTDRFFLGVRVSDELLDETLQYYQDKKSDIYSLWENFEPLDDKQRLEALDFIDAFYALVENPKAVQSEIKKRMRSISGLDKSTAKKIERLKAQK